MSDKELSVVIWVGGFMLTIIGGLASLCGSIFMLLLRRDRICNSNEHDEFKMIDQKLFDKIEDMNETLNILKGEHNARKCGK